MFFHEGVTTKIFEFVAITFAWDGVRTNKKRCPLRDVDTQLQVLGVKRPPFGWSKGHLEEAGW